MAITRYRVVASTSNTTLADGFDTREAAAGWTEADGYDHARVERYEPEYVVHAFSGSSDLGRSYGPASLADCAGYLVAPRAADARNVAAAAYQLAVRRVDCDGLAELDEDERDALMLARDLAAAEADEDEEAEGEDDKGSQCGGVMRHRDDGQPVRRLCGSCAQEYAETCEQPSGCGAYLR